MTLCPQCNAPVTRGVLFCNNSCRDTYSKTGTMELPLAYDAILPGKDTIAILGAVLINIKHTLPVTQVMRWGHHADPTGILCQLSHLGEWQTVGKDTQGRRTLWHYVTPKGMDYMGPPSDVVEWSGLTLKEVELIQYSYDYRGRKRKGDRRSFASLVISGIIETRKMRLLSKYVRDLVGVTE